jgi:hypothetical protein
VAFATKAGSGMTIGHGQAPDELARSGVAGSLTSRAWLAAAGAAAAVTAIVAGLVLVPALAQDQAVPSPSLPPVPSSLPPGVVPWVGAVAPPATVFVPAHPVGISSQLNALTATLTFPANITSGTTVSYAVTLANPTRRAVSLSPCPSYSETFADGGAAVAYYYLSCGAVPSIPAGRSVTFQMIGLVPGQPGKVSVVWRLQQTGVTARAIATAMPGTPAGVVS